MNNMFYWGAATSAHQVEGGNHNDWTEFERKHRLELSGLACDHYNRFREDFDIAKELNHNAHRFSVEWSRIEPEEGKFNEQEIRHYQEVVRALQERNIEPFVTLYHWTQPLWFRDIGGWLHRDSAAYFARFAEKIVQALPNVQFWITLNEPDVYTTHGYLKGIWPPEKKSIRKFFKANRNLIKAHRECYKKIKIINPKACIGIAQNINYFEAAGRNPINKTIQWFLEFFGPWYVLDRICNFQDFVGVNYYSRNRINWSINKNENKVTSDMGWEVYPLGLYYVLKRVQVRYKKPIYIFENGIADRDDSRRADFIKNHIMNMRKAMSDGVDVKGYFYWSLLDNFEWAYGFGPRFGLVHIDYTTLKRTIRPSGLEYKKIIGN